MDVLWPNVREPRQAEAWGRGGGHNSELRVLRDYDMDGPPKSSPLLPLSLVSPLYKDTTFHYLFFIKILLYPAECSSSPGTGWHNKTAMFTF